MPVELYHHPYTRAGYVLYMLEEVGCDYILHPVDVMKGEQRAPELLALNPMGKIPILVDEGVVITESAAIAMYLADRYSPGVLAPALDDPARATYLRWICFAPSVIEPGAMAKAGKWDVNVGAAGWGTAESMYAAIREAIGEGPWILGDRFSMADIVFGGTLRFLLSFGMIEPEPAFTAYVQRLEARPALQRADQKNAEISASLGLEG